MKRHISIFAFLLCAFAAAVPVGQASADDQRVLAWRQLGNETATEAGDSDAVVSPSRVFVGNGGGAPASKAFTATLPDGTVAVDWCWTQSAERGVPQNWKAVSSADKHIAVSADKSTLTWTYESSNLSYVLFKYRYITYNLEFRSDMSGVKIPDNRSGVSYGESFALGAPTPTPTGYHFGGWIATSTFDKGFKKTFASGETAGGGAFGLAKCREDGKMITLTANWTTNAYTIAFDANGGAGEPMNPLDMTYDVERALPPCTYARTGYAFKGWTRNQDGTGTVYADGVKVSNLTDEDHATVTLYAKWEALSYDVELSLNGGSFPEGDKPLKIMTKVDEVFGVAAPERDNWTFAGWTVVKVPEGSSYAGAKWGTEPNGTTHDVKDATTKCLNGAHGTVFFKNLTLTAGVQVFLKAIWIRTIRATADPKEAGTVTGATNYGEGELATLTAITNAGYAFCCWTNETGVVTNANPWTFTVEGDADFVAVFTGRVYRVEFRGEGGDPASQVVDETVGSKWKFPPKEPLRMDYKFDGWTTQPAGAGEVLSETDTITNIPHSVAYANWKQNDGFAVVWRWVDASGKIGSGETNVPPNTIIKQADADAATARYLKKPEHSFRIKKWNPELPVEVICSTNITGELESYSDVLDCTNLTFDVRKNWEVNTDKGFCAMGDSCLKLTAIGGDDFVSVKVSESGELTFNWKAGATKTGLLFIKKEDGTTVRETMKVDEVNKWTSVTVKVSVASEDNPAEIRFLPDPVAFDGYLALDHVTWTPGLPPPPEPHTVEVAADGPGAVSKSPVRETYVEGETVTLTAVADTGYAFCCWTNETGVVTNANPWTFTVTDDVRYWAMFTNCPPVGVGYTVTVMGGGHGTARKSPDLSGYEEGAVVTLTALPDPGYAFALWSDGSADANHDVTVTSNASYTATFTASVYTVTFDANGGELQGAATKSVTYGEPYGALPEDPVKEGLSFADWWTAKSGGIKVTPSTKVTSAKDHTLYAHWATGDMGELSKVLDCADLRFEEAVAGWTKYTGDWHNGDSCLRATASGAKVFARLSGSGTLIFWWRASGAKMQKATISVVAGNMTKICEAEAKKETDWTKESIEIAADTEEISFVVTTPGAYCEIDDITWTPALLPESIVTNAVPVAVSGLVYTGGALTGVKEGDGYSIVGNVATNAGGYTATATPDGGTVWEGGSSAPTNIAWSIAKATYDLSGVTFANVTNVADGARKSIFVSGALPTGVTVAYEGNGQSEPGEYTVTAKFTGDATNYEAIPDKTATLTILEPPEPPESVATNAVPKAVGGLVYDGTAKTGVAAGANYTIVGNVATNAGGYTAVATVTNGVWEGGATGATNIAWTIAKATVDMSGVTFTSATYEFDGEEHSIAVAGVPSGVEVVYSGATNRTEVGTNTVTASFRVLDEQNYNAITKLLTATLAITAKEDPPGPPPGPTPPDPPVVTNAVPKAVGGLVYDGTAKTGVAAGANYTIVGNVATNAGGYAAVATVTNGVWEGGATGATNIAWTIAKATVDMSGVTFASATYEWDGEEHSIAVHGVPSGVEVVYTGDATNRTEVGTNTVTASFRVLDELNYNAIATQLTATLAIVEPPDPAVAYENIYFKATLAELGAEAVPTNRKITIKAEGLPKGLKLVTAALKDAKNKATGYYAYTVEGVPTEMMDGLSRMAYVRVTDNKVQTLYALDLSVLLAKAYEDKSLPDGEVNSEYANFSVTNLWPDVAKNPKNWTFSGWPVGIKLATKTVTTRKKVDGVYVTLTNALAHEVYGKPTKAGRFTVKAIEKVAGTSYKSTHVATFTVWPEGKAGNEWTDQAYVGVYRESDKSVKSASGLPTGVRFTAKDIVSRGEVTTQAHHFYGTPTKAGTYAVTLTHEDKSKTQFLWTITPAAVPAFELKLTETAVDPVTAKATIRQGVGYNWTIDATAGATVTASGLPTGLKLVKTAVKSGAKIVGYDYSVSGVPTKAGEFFVTFTAKRNGVSTVTTAAFTVLDLPAWAQGTFDGGADETFAAGGQATFTVSKAGKLSGKWLSEGTNWTLSAASYDCYDAETASYVAQVVCKTGSGKKARVFTNELVVAKDSVGGAVTGERFLAYQNNWRIDPWKTLGKKVAKSPVFEFRPYADADDDHTNDVISLKFAASGKVTVKASYFKSRSTKTGKISWTTASGSAVLCPQGLPDGTDAFPAVVFVYFPPKKGTPTAEAAYAVCVRLRWDGAKFIEWTDPE